MRTDANGKEWPLTKTVVSKFYGREKVAAPKTGKAPAGKTGVASVAKAAPLGKADVKAMIAKRKLA